MAESEPLSDRAWRNATERRLERYGAMLARHEAAIEIEVPKFTEVEGVTHHLHQLLLRMNSRLTQTFEEILGRFERSEAKRDAQLEGIAAQLTKLEDGQAETNGRLTKLEDGQAETNGRLEQILNLLQSR